MMVPTLIRFTDFARLWNTAIPNMTPAGGDFSLWTFWDRECVSSPRIPRSEGHLGGALDLRSAGPRAAHIQMVLRCGKLHAPLKRAVRRCRRPLCCTHTATSYLRPGVAAM